MLARDDDAHASPALSRRYVEVLRVATRRCRIGVTSDARCEEWCRASARIIRARRYAPRVFRDAGAARLRAATLFQRCRALLVPSFDTQTRYATAAPYDIPRECW